MCIASRTGDLWLEWNSNATLLARESSPEADLLACSKLFRDSSINSNSCEKRHPVCLKTLEEDSASEVALLARNSFYIIFNNTEAPTFLKEKISNETFQST